MRHFSNIIMSCLELDTGHAGIYANIPLFNKKIAGRTAGTLPVRSRYGRGMLAVRSRFGRGAVHVRSRCDRGTLVVRSRYARGAVEVYKLVRFRYAHRCRSGAVLYHMTAVYPVSYDSSIPCII